MNVPGEDHHRMVGRSYVADQVFVLGVVGKFLSKYDKSAFFKPFLNRDLAVPSPSANIGWPTTRTPGPCNPSIQCPTALRSSSRRNRTPLVSRLMRVSATQTERGGTSNCSMDEDDWNARKRRTASLNHHSRWPRVRLLSRPTPPKLGALFQNSWSSEQK